MTFASSGATYNIGALSASSTASKLSLTAISGGSITLSVGGNHATSTYSGLLSGAGGLTVTGGSQTLFNANNAVFNTFSGNVNINGGTLLLSSGSYQTSAAATVLGNMTAAGRTINVNNGGTLAFLTGNTMGDTASTVTVPVIINQGGEALNVNGGNTTLGPVVLNGGTLADFGNGSAGYQPYNLGAAAGSISATGSANSYISLLSGAGATGGLRMFGGANTFSVSGGGVLYVSMPLMNQNNGNNNAGTAASLTKTGTGELVLSGSTAYNGSTTISAGTLQLGNGTANTGTLVAGIANNATLVIDEGPGTATIGGVVSGAGTILDIGSGLTILTSNSNSFTGNVNLSSGTLRLNGGATAATGPSPMGAITSTGTFTVGTGATLQWNNSNEMGDNNANNRTSLVIDGTLLASGSFNNNLGSSLTLSGGSLLGQGGTNFGMFMMNFQQTTGTINATAANSYIGLLGVPTTYATALQLTNTTTINVAGPGTLTINVPILNVNTNASETTLAAMNSGPAATLVKTGTGLLNLEGSSVYSGGTVVSAGTLEANFSATAGTATALGNLVTGGTVVVGSGAVLQLAAGNVMGQGNQVAATIPTNTLSIQQGGLVISTVGNNTELLGPLSLSGGTLSGLGGYGGSGATAYRMFNFGQMPQSDRNRQRQRAILHCACRRRYHHV